MVDLVGHSKTQTNTFQPMCLNLLNVEEDDSKLQSSRTEA